MALADSVPGVSGGTIAFLLGFYDSFINSLNDIMGRDNAKRKKAFFFLIKLGVGWVIGMLLAVSVLANVFESGIYKVSSLFLGFIILAIPVMIMEEKESIKGKYYNIIWAVIGIAIVVGISLINPSGSGADVSHMNIPETLIRIFSSDTALIQDAVPALNTYFAAFIFMDLQYIGQAVFKSLNKKVFAIFFSLLRKVFIVVPLTYFLPYVMHMGTDGVFLAEPVSNVIGGTACILTMLITIMPELKRIEVENRRTE